MKALLLCTEAYGGHGGIALYNRDLADAARGPLHYMRAIAHARRATPIL